MNYLKKSIINYANRGMNLENEINMTNSYYKLHDIALVYKKPTPIKIIKVDYKSRGSAKIDEAYFMEPSTLDYNGIYKGVYLDFDAKECHSKTSFPISNIHVHQIEHIRKVLYHGGISFIIVSFTLLQKVYLLFGEDLLNYMDHCDRKSIPISVFEKDGYLIDIKYNPRIDYIRVIDNYMEDKNEKGY